MHNNECHSQMLCSVNFHLEKLHYIKQVLNFINTKDANLFDVIVQVPQVFLCERKRVFYFGIAVNLAAGAGASWTGERPEIIPEWYRESN